ncbi:hypothetical protein OG874_00410 [Nocardia sp. NBC_00565]|uniref:hypothetical protein n=1 Tax=Nocardia sp. NBC_00565 TaxID=2975993 RepID=UPI002E804DE0|nr:hypothetical protein [Nocardia sp. NBC_00565]WUC03717.1 hypothetical protein OG874_00410 [Nocardia sp. NBC_00565]
MSTATYDPSTNSTPVSEWLTTTFPEADPCQLESAAAVMEMGAGPLTVESRPGQLIVHASLPVGNGVVIGLGTNDVIW